MQHLQRPTLGRLITLAQAALNSLPDDDETALPTIGDVGKEAWNSVLVDKVTQDILWEMADTMPDNPEVKAFKRALVIQLGYSLQDLLGEDGLAIGEEGFTLTTVGAERARSIGLGDLVEYH